MVRLGLKEKEVKKFILIFYCIAILGFLIPFSRPIFEILTPFALIVNFFVLFYFHNSKKILNDTIVFFVIFCCGLAIEIIGVQTKIIFGNYTYGNGLGVKVFDTPLIIGLNWLFVTYITHSVVDRFNKNKVLKVILASLLMLIYDIVLEQVAPQIDMWYWTDNHIPLQNYIMWFFLALVFNTLIQIFKVHTKNPLSMLIFSCQFLFFVFLYVFFKTMI